MPTSTPTGSDVAISFEFFPPSDDAGEARLWETVRELAPLGPEFLSVTYGAGGSTQVHTDRIVRRIAKETDLTPTAHLTCVGQSRSEVVERARGWWQAGVRSILALRGDPPKGSRRFQPHPDGFRDAAELVGALQEMAPFHIGVGGYPEVHPDSPSEAADTANLKRKVDAGADRIITQFFFETDDFLRFRDRCDRAGIEVPVIPGVLPIFNFGKVKRFAQGCGAKVPGWLEARFEGLDADPETRALVAASVASEQCNRLLAEGVRHFHFYTLNRARLTYAVCRAIGVAPAVAAEAA
jgi:methylenetetrahydrofolate reductase (NADPH)